LKACRQDDKFEAGFTADGMNIRTLEREVLFRGRLYRLVRSLVKLPGCAPVTRECIEHPGAIAVVPIRPGNRVVLIRQYRFAVRGFLWEIPAGTLEPGESPRRCAGRELMEETGFRAGRLEPLGIFYTAPGFCNERMHLFLARDLRPARRRGDADEIIYPKTFPLTDALNMAITGRIRDAKTHAGLFLAAERLGIVTQGTRIRWNRTGRAVRTSAAPRRTRARRAQRA
jgi:ADP-ribose pyrophosphatase